jgi:ubiquinone biosynthesis monooxygenase Coq7
MSLTDRALMELDKALRTLWAPARAARQNPAAAIADGALSEAQKRHSAALMRVNHAGEVCAQALYAGQSLTARSATARRALEQAAREEEDHLAWSAQRISELGGSTSLLNPLWYAGSLAIGAVAGALGDRWNLGFLAETEGQVEKHLEGHLRRMSPGDARTRAVVEAMRADEARHRASANALGAAKLPAPIKSAMRLASKLMTTASYRV